MATVNLGRIKPVFRGAYSGSTAYVIDDIVTHGNESFICIQAHGAGTQATSQGSYWTKLAAKGTDGTDVGTTITTQGDILYRDGSGLQRLAKPASNKFLQNTSGGVVSWQTVSSEVVNTTMTAFQDAVNAGDRKRNPYVWTRYNTAVTVTDASNYFLWEVNGYVNHDNHPAGSVEVQEDSGSFVNAYNKSTLTGTAIVQANGESSWGSNDHLSRYPHFRFDTAVNTNNNYAQPSSTAGIYKPTGTPTTLNFRVSFWSENSTSNLIIGANPSGGSSHGCPPLSYLKITEIKA
jgi:hypothetical protein